MSVEKLIVTMERLVKLHRNLLELSNKKTDIVIKGDMKALNQILKDEQALLAAMNQFENERQKIAGTIVTELNQPTISDCIKVVDETSKNTLEQLRNELLELASQLKQKNELNQQLIFQSLHFVNFSLSLFFPQREEFNYSPGAGKGKEPGYSPSLFNSKA